MEEDDPQGETVEEKNAEINEQSRVPRFPVAAYGKFVSDTSGYSFRTHSGQNPWVNAMSEFSWK